MISSKLAHLLRTFSAVPTPCFLTGSYRVANTEAGLTGVAWQPYQASLPWTLLPGLGCHTVYVQYRDAAGN
jgi:hypothetical protein